MKIAPSILAADFTKLGEEVQAVLDAGADWIHVDVMDGQFVPNISMGPLVVSALRRRFNCCLDVHLMIVEPQRYIAAFAEAGASRITVHAESTPHVHRALQQIHDFGLPAGLAVNPGTGLDSLETLVDEVDSLLVMTVNPGFGGQSLIPGCVRKVEAARSLLRRLGKPDVLIEVDGGVDPNTIGSLAAAGADVFVAGTAIFSQPDYRAAIHHLRAMSASADN